jgi:myosin heavy subunit
LGPPDTYHYLNQSGCFDVPGINDANDFKDTKNACKIMNIQEDEQDSIFRVIAGILHLGNINFTQSYPTNIQKKYEKYKKYEKSKKYEKYTPSGFFLLSFFLFLCVIV